MARSRITPRIHLWQGNLAVFVTFFLTVVGYSSWQAHLAKERFLSHAQDQATLLAEVVRRHARSAVFSRTIVEEVVRTQLANTARFVEYLDDVERFTETELSAFAAEAGLRGILVAGEGSPRQGPEHWYPLPEVSCTPAGSFRHVSEAHLFVLEHPRTDIPSGGCVIVGLTAERIEEFQQNLALPNLFKTMTALPGIGYVTIEPGEKTGLSSETETSASVDFVSREGSRFAEATLALDDDVLRIGLKADKLFQYVGRIRRDLVLFSLLLAAGGGVLSWLLYRQQAGNVRQMLEVERTLSHAREEAALGRAAAAIAHEIRNPLNAIAMGLQRLRMEAPELTGEHRDLLAVMLDSVRRTDTIVGGLLRYARPQQPAPRKERLSRVLDEVLTLYRPRMDAAGIQFHWDVPFDEPILIDPDLMRQVFENLLKNAVEAQPDGGRVRIRIGAEGDRAVVTFENEGFRLGPDEADRIVEPYFTTKTQGTGLGLPISSRIVTAHGGRMEVETPGNETLRITVSLPMA